MNPSPDTGTTSPPVAPGKKAAKRDSIPTNWREALMSLIASRVALIQLESKDAAGGAIRSAALILAACGCVFFSWALLLAGMISQISALTDWPWRYIALGIAGIHLLAGLIMARFAIRRSPGASFPITCAEFQKDREWIENFQKNTKSND